MMSSRAYAKEFGLAMVAYGVVLFLSIWLINANPTAPWRFAVALLPMLPAIGVLVAVLRQLRRMDELQRRIQFEALAFAFAGTALLTFGYGFVENVGLPHLSWFWVWPIMAVLWIVGTGLAARRYDA
jgi:O-antigen/teichoic acid export membrane protein